MQTKVEGKDFKGDRYVAWLEPDELTRFEVLKMAGYTTKEAINKIYKERVK